MTLPKNSPLFLFLALHLFISQVNADEAEITTPPPPAINAAAYILQDYHTGKILAESNADAKLAPASLTKIMTVYTVLREISNGHLKFDDLVTISQKPATHPAPACLSKSMSGLRLKTY